MRNATRLAVFPRLLLISALMGPAILGGCNRSGGSTSSSTSSGTSSGGSEASNGGAALKGDVTLDGSSTVLPISAAVAEDFDKANTGVHAVASASGTGGGFKKFAAGEIDIAGASRPIEAVEAEACKKNGIEFVEIPIAYDGLSIVVNKENSFLEDISVADLKKIWEGGSKAKTWRDVNPAWPASPMSLFGPGTDSGTFDYFTEAICGRKGNSRTDYQPSEDDNILVKGVQGDKFSMGYFGFAYYEENQDTLKLVKVGGVAPSKETILDGTYSPLSRPLFWYVNAKSLARPEVRALVEFLLKDPKKLVEESGYVTLPDAAYASDLSIVSGKKTGTRFKGGETGLKIEDVLAREPK